MPTFKNPIINIAKGAVFDYNASAVKNQDLVAPEADGSEPRLLRCALILMHQTGVNRITKHTWPEVYRRFYMYEMGIQTLRLWDDVGDDRMFKPEEVESLVGLTAEVSEQTRKDFNESIAWNMRNIADNHLANYANDKANQKGQKK